MLIGGHLDSWDLGTGAIDDGAGVGLTMAAGALIGKLKQRPARTIRVVAFANEEQGLHGGKAYAARHLGDIAQAPDRRGERFRCRPHLRLPQRRTGLRPERRAADRRGAGAAGHRVHARPGRPGPGHQPVRRQGHGLGVAAPGRHRLLRLPPHAGRHPRQDRSRRRWRRTWRRMRCSPISPRAPKAISAASSRRSRQRRNKAGTAQGGTGIAVPRGRTTLCANVSARREAPTTPQEGPGRDLPRGRRRRR